MTALDIFTYGVQQVRTVIVDGEPWFAAADVTRILGYQNGRAAVARHTKEVQRGVSRFATPSADQDMTIISEAGVYRLVMRSNTDDAIEFQEWLASFVLPQIRRTGEFRQTEVEHALPTSYADALRELAATVERAVELEAKAAINAPKVAAYDTLMDAEGFYTMEAAAKLGGIGRNTFFARLRDAGVIQSGSRLPYQRYMHWFKLTTATWTDGDGVAHLSTTARVLPDALAKVLQKAGCTISQAVAS